MWFGAKIFKNSLLSNCSKTNSSEGGIKDILPMIRLFAPVAPVAKGTYRLFHIFMQQELACHS